MFHSVRRLSAALLTPRRINAARAGLRSLQESWRDGPDDVRLSAPALGRRNLGRHAVQIKDNLIFTCIFSLERTSKVCL